MGARIAWCALFVLALARGGVATLRAGEHVEITAANRIAAGAAEWRGLAERFARQPDAMAQFEETRRFPFRKEPVVLKGVVRVSRTRGLSLEYAKPEERVIILDEAGVLVRDGSGQQLPPDPRAAAANRALLHVLQLDVAALEKEFEVYGRKTGDAWALTLVPRDGSLRRAIGNIHVAGNEVVVERVELRRSAKQHIDIVLSGHRAPVVFTAEEAKRYFR